MKKTSKKYFGFTLVELIIVITILAILSTVAFVSFQGYTKNSRDSVRLENLSNIEKGLEVFNIKSGTYPTPDKAITISLSGSPISYQGTLGDNSSKIVGFSKTPTDPLDNSNYYYSTNINQKGYSLLGFAENQTAFIQEKALADNSTKTTLTKGSLSYILDKDNNALISDTDLFGNGSGTVYNQIINNTKKLTGSGINIGGGYQMLSLKNGDYSAPKSCPEGFIPVVGSSEFSQPGFCVMKYEASYEDATTPNSGLTPANKDLNASSYDTDQDWNTVDYIVGKKVVSKAGVYPIGNITQISAIQACSQVGGHLITNNEWMTISRQIEANPINWSNGQVGSGYISNGVSNDATLGCGGTNTKTQYPNLPILTRVWATKTGAGFGTNQEAIACDKKRQLTLSNGEVIWDLAGNLREHVNKNNTKNGEAYKYGQTSFLGCNNSIGWSESNSCSNTFSNTSINKYDSLKGMGQIYYSQGVSNNIFLRGGNATNVSTTGFFTLKLDWSGSHAYRFAGFRCAY